MADPDQLVVHLLPLGLELDPVGERLPAASSTGAEMLAECLYAVRRRLDDPRDEALHVVFLLLENPDVHDVARNGEIDENDHPVHACECFSFGRHRFDGDVLQQQIHFFPAHRTPSSFLLYKFSQFRRK